MSNFEESTTRVGQFRPRYESRPRAPFVEVVPARPGKSSEPVAGEDRLVECRISQRLLTERPGRLVRAQVDPSPLSSPPKLRRTVKWHEQCDSIGHDGQAGGPVSPFEVRPQGQGARDLHRCGAALAYDHSRRHPGCCGFGDSSLLLSVAEGVVEIGRSRSWSCSLLRPEYRSATGSARARQDPGTRSRRTHALLCQRFDIRVSLTAQGVEDEPVRSQWEVRSLAARPGPGPRSGAYGSFASSIAFPVTLEALAPCAEGSEPRSTAASARARPHRDGLRRGRR